MVPVKKDQVLPMQRIWINLAITGDPSLKEGDILVVDPIGDDVELIDDLFWSKLRNQNN